MDHSVSRRTLLRAGGAAAAAGALGLHMATPASAAPAAGGRRSAALTGRTIQVDPGFAYYQGRSVESVAEELYLAGYRAVRVVITSERNVNGPLVRALRKQGIATWAMVFGNGTYSVEGFPEEWPQWRMGLINPDAISGYTFFSHFSSPYRQWKREAAAGVVADHPFDGFEMAEAYFPEWNGLQTGVYGDVGPLAQEAFRQRYGQEPPTFTDPESPLHYARPENATRYQQWVDLRVDAVNTLVDDIFNGPGGVRDTRPQTLVASWSLAIDGGPDSLALLRERQGLDAAAMVRRVRPDLHIFQSHWPDWSRTDLPPDYVAAYQPFVADVRRVAPRLPLGVQADVGSWHTAERDRAWQTTFASTAAGVGLSTWTAYEYHISGIIYGEPPVPVTARRLDGRRVRVSFSKRIDDQSATQPGSFVIAGTGTQPTAVTVDGNRADLTFPRLPGDAFQIAVSQVRDGTQYWLGQGHGHPANIVPAGTTVRVG